MARPRKLTMVQVQQILESFNSVKDLAAAFNVSQATIYNIKNGKGTFAPPPTTAADITHSEEASIGA